MPSMQTPVRLLPFASLPGPEQMAADDALLAAAAEQGIAALRFYTWATPTLSLGYFQPAADRLTDPRLAALPWVRRATGGAALVHDHELTYAFALPPARTPLPAGESWVCRAHYVIRDALAALGVTTRAVVCGEEKTLGPVLCFREQTAGDLVCDGHKVAGSAQRRSKGATLQHGSVLLARSEHAPDLPGLQELAGLAVPPSELAARLALYFSLALGWDLDITDWTADDLTARAESLAARYGSPAWNEKR